MKAEPSYNHGPYHQAFTLVELLVVISIIAVLAGLGVGLGPGVVKNMRLKRTRADLAQLVTALSSWSTKYGAYPPDNTNYTVLNGATQYAGFPNTLYYELTGATYDPKTDSFRSAKGDVLKAQDIARATGIRGVRNASDNLREVQNFLPNFKPSEVTRISTNGVDFDVLMAPVRNARGGATYWYYRSTNPTNNPTTFDLWTEVVVGKHTNVIGNW